MKKVSFEDVINQIDSTQLSSITQQNQQSQIQALIKSNMELQRSVVASISQMSKDIQQSLNKVESAVKEVSSNKATEESVVRLEKAINKLIIVTDTNQGEMNEALYELTDIVEKED